MTHLQAYDDDRSLFLVYDVSEARLSADCPPHAETVSVVPSEPGRPEVWPDSGFATVGGELLYHGSVKKGGDGRAVALTDCSRSLNGEPSVFQPAGTWVRGLVVAEHHNRLAGAVMRAQDFVGRNFDPRTETLDWRIRNLAELEVAADDHTCPEVTLDWFVLEDHPVRGVLARFLISIESGGGAFRLDFGDGTSTTTERVGTHRYGPGTRVDPVLTVTTATCETVITPPGRTEGTDPRPQTATTFDFPLPEFPNIPDFVPVTPEFNEPEVVLPPIVFPCLSVQGSIGPIPSEITGPSLPSSILIESPTPVNLPHSVVTIEGGQIQIPSYVFVDAPTEISVIDDIPSVISVVQSVVEAIPLSADGLDALKLDVAPLADLRVGLALPKRKKLVPAEGDFEDFGGEFGDLREAAAFREVEVEELGIPEEIRITAPESLPPIEIRADGLPSVIRVDAEGLSVPSKIEFGDHGLPGLVRIEGGEKVPSVVRVDAGGSTV